MQIALTGAAGHLGAALVRQLLEDGHAVRALVFKEDKALQGLPVESVRGNLDDPKSLQQLCEGAAVVQHLAGRISIGGVPEQELWQVNVEGTQRVIQACLAAGVPRLIYFSSAHAFSPCPKT